jgi:hypothetical protein
MIAEAVVATGLPPEAFGVPASEELGGLVIEVLTEQAEEADRAERTRRLHKR